MEEVGLDIWLLLVVWWEEITRIGIMLLLEVSRGPCILLVTVHMWCGKKFDKTAVVDLTVEHFVVSDVLATHTHSVRKPQPWLGLLHTG